MNLFFILRLCVLAGFSVPLAVSDRGSRLADLRVLAALLLVLSALCLPHTELQHLAAALAVLAGLTMFRALPLCRLGTGDILYMTALVLTGGFGFFRITVLMACLAGIIPALLCRSKKHSHPLPFITITALCLPFAAAVQLCIELVKK